MTTTMIRPTTPIDPRRGPVGPVVGGGPADRYRRCHRSVDARRPNYARRRLLAAATLLVALVAVLPVVAAVPGVVAAVVGGTPAAASSPSGAGGADVVVHAARHVVQPGDTLWSIAAEHRGDVGHADYLDALIALNGGTTIQLGQAVVLP